MSKQQFYLNRLLFGFVSILSMLLSACGQDTGSIQQPVIVQTVSPGAINLVVDQDKSGPFLISNICHFPGQPAPSLVAIVTVDTLLPGRWDTPDGLRPAHVTSKNVLSSGYLILTPVHFSQMQVLWDKRSLPTKEFITRGGQAKQDRIIYTEEPTLTPNQSYLVVFRYNFVPHSKLRNPHQLFVDAALPMKTPQVVITQQQTIEQGKITQHEETMTLDQVRQILAGCTGRPIDS